MHYFSQSIMWATHEQNILLFMGKIHTILDCLKEYDLAVIAKKKIPF